MSLQQGLRGMGSISEDGETVGGGVSKQALTSPKEDASTLQFIRSS